MPKHTKSATACKAKPEKPTPDFPLFPHQCGSWAKKIRGRMFYFGPWDDPAGALKKFERDWPWRKNGLEPPADNNEGQGGICLADVCDQFLQAKQNRLESGELSPQTFADYRLTSDALVDHFGKNAVVAVLGPADWEKYRAKLARKYAVRTLKNEINRVRIVFKWAHDQGLAEKPAYGQSFEKPSAKMIRKARNAAPKRLYSQTELLAILTVADVYLKAMVLLGINAGLGNTDIANLPKSAIDFDQGWLDYPRPKTEIERRISLWPETLEAVKAAIEKRPRPRDPRDSELVFITVQGNRWVRTTTSKRRSKVGDDLRYVTVNTIAGRFKLLTSKLKISRTFYDLRHTFETIGGEAKDQIAVNSLMGHADHSMSAHYREGVSDERLKAVTDHIHSWLFGMGVEADGND